jgi:6-phosphogluconolactonase
MAGEDKKARLTGVRTEIIIEASAADIARTGADIWRRSAQESIALRGQFALAISGGSTPRRMHRLLAQEPYLSRLPWGKTHIFWVDERCVPMTHPDSNFGIAKKDFLDRVPIVPEQIHPMPGWIPPEQGAIMYEKELNAFFQRDETAVPCLDLIFLGIGSDGHTASLFPGQASLEEKEKWVVSVKGGIPCVDRLTMTYPVLNLAKRIVFLASGKDKAKVLKTALENIKAQLPAQKVRPSTGNLTWLVDGESALLLS